MHEDNFDAWTAWHYALLWPELFDPEVVDSTVDFLAELAGTGAALEFGIGTGRIALPLSRRGTRVAGIELSAAMLERLKAEPGASAIRTTRGDFASARLGATFTLVYLIRNTITNLTTQDEQVEAFLNAALHLEPGGCFVVENYIPALQRLPPGETTRVFTATPTHLGFEEYDPAHQIAISHHYWRIGGELRTRSTPHRYLWPAELDLMARLAGLRLRERWSDWSRAPFTSDSREHVSVWQKPR
jgi:SAM-dependent methyltransferase